MPTRPERGGAAVLGDCAELVGELGGGRLAVGIGLCELVDLTGRPTSADTIDWRDLDPAAAIEAPRVIIESDVRAAALAEARFGAGAGVSPFLFADRRDGRERLPRRRRPPVRRRARRGDRARCAAGRAGRERLCARPGGRARAGRGRPRGSGARGARRRGRDVRSAACSPCSPTRSTRRWSSSAAGSAPQPAFRERVRARASRCSRTRARPRFRSSARGSRRTEGGRSGTRGTRRRRLGFAPCSTRPGCGAT